MPQRPALAERRIWSVRALVADIRQHIETNYTDLWVEGEISNCRIAPSGHVYFTLKDGEAQLPVVLFRRQALLLRFRPADGLAVLVRGRYRSMTRGDNFSLWLRRWSRAGRVRFSWPLNSSRRGCLPRGFLMRP